MPGDTDLAKLIRHMNPEMDDRSYLFTVYDAGSSAPELLDYWAMIREKEGTTYIITADEAQKYGIRAERNFKRITFNVYSSLEAVGLTAAVATELARHDISANVVAGYYHDHLFVPEEKAKEALAVLQRLSESD